jgi:hypothetical protein
MHLKCRLHVAQMQIHKTNIEKMTITGIKYQDAIDVMFEDYKVGEGEVTITCYGDSWNCYWGSMGDRNIREFFQKADNDYLIRKFEMGIHKSNPDESEEAIRETLYKWIISERKNEHLTESMARDNWDNVSHIYRDGTWANDNTIADIMGPDWHDDLPKIPNQTYESLNRIITHIKNALDYTDPLTKIN